MGSMLLTVIRPLVRGWFFSFIILFSLPAAAQQANLFSGYYLSLENDTIRGTFSDYKEWSKSPSKVKFLTSAGKEVILIPTEVKSFFIEGYESYLSFNGKRLINPILDEELYRVDGYLPSDDILGDTSIFIREIVALKSVALYELNDNRRWNYFLKKNDSLVELVYKKTVDGLKISELPEYRRQLKQLFNNEVAENNLSKEVEDLSYQEKSLVRFLERLLNQKSIKKSRFPNKWIISAGVANITSRGTNSRQDVNLTPTSYANKVSPVVTVAFFFSPDRNFGRYFLSPSVSFYTYSTNGSATNKDYYVTVNYKANAFSTALKAGMNFLNKGNTRSYISGGVGYLHIIKGKEFRNVYKHDGFLFMQQEAALRSMTLFAEATVGTIIKNRFSAALSWSPPFNITQYALRSTKISLLQLQLGYNIGKK